VVFSDGTHRHNEITYSKARYRQLAAEKRKESMNTFATFAFLSVSGILSLFSGIYLLVIYGIIAALGALILIGTMLDEYRVIVEYETLGEE
jgi:hypothetical protein